MTKVIWIMNQLTQLSKTITTFNLRCVLALMNKTVILVDMHPNRQLSQDGQLADVTFGVNQVLQNEVKIERATGNLTDGLDVILTRVNCISLQSMVSIISLFKRLEKIANGAKLWLIPTQIKRRDKMTSKMTNSLKSQFARWFYGAAVRQDNASMESRRQKKAIFGYALESDATDYFSLVEEIIERRVS